VLQQRVQSLQLRPDLAGHGLLQVSQLLEKQLQVRQLGDQVNLRFQPLRDEAQDLERVLACMRENRNHHEVELRRQLPKIRVFLNLLHLLVKSREVH